MGGKQSEGGRETEGEENRGREADIDGREQKGTEGRNRGEGIGRSKGWGKERKRGDRILSRTEGKD